MKRRRATAGPARSRAAPTGRGARGTSGETEREARARRVEEAIAIHGDRPSPVDPSTALAAIHGDGWMRVEQAAKLLDRNVQTIYRWAREGIIPVRRFGRAVEVRPVPKEETT